MMNESGRLPSIRIVLSLNFSYTWAGSRYGVFNPVRTVQADDSDEAGWRPEPGYTLRRRDPLGPTG